MLYQNYFNEEPFTFGSLENAPYRPHFYIEESEIKEKIDLVNKIAKEKKMPVKNVIKIFECLVQERRNNITICGGDFTDQYLKIFGDKLDCITNILKNFSCHVWGDEHNPISIENV